MIAQLEAFLFRQGVPFLHLTATHRQAVEAERMFMTLVPDFRRNGAAKFRDCRMTGAGMEHVPVIILQDRVNMDPLVLEEYLLVVAPSDGCEPMVIEVQS